MTDGPTSEIGYVRPGGRYATGIYSYQDEDLNPNERVHNLRWPDSIQQYEYMRNDPQVDALLRGLTAPIRRFHWSIDPAGAKKSVAAKLAEDLGLPVISGKNLKRRLNKRRTFRHDEHLRTALLAMIYGHMFFEQVGVVRDGMWRLKKLAPRMPHTISQIKIARDGGLDWIEQWDGDGNGNTKQIPINRLVAFVFEKEGANWFGRSLLRSAYQPWLLKDRLLRVDAIRHERNGMGVPIIEMPERATPKQVEEARKLAEQYRTGMASGGAMPNGMKLRLVGVEGKTSDVLASIRYQDEQIARIMIQSFMNIGSTSTAASRAVGDAFIKQTARAQDAIAEWYIDVMNEYVILDWVEWNYGPDEEAPLLVYKRQEDPELSAHELSQMVAMGALTVDDELENFLRERYGLPPLTFSPDGTGRRRELGQTVPQKRIDTAEQPPSKDKPNQNIEEPPPGRVGGEG